MPSATQQARIVAQLRGSRPEREAALAELLALEAAVDASASGATSHGP
jgi:hypothetical protein